MKILFYSTKDFEQPYIEAANGTREEVIFIKEALSLQTADKAKGFDVIDALTNITVTTFYNIDCWKRNQHSKNELSMQGRLTEAAAYIDDEEA